MLGNMGTMLTDRTKRGRNYKFVRMAQKRYKKRTRRMDDGYWLGQLFGRIVQEFHIGSRENLDVKRKMQEGFSGAEVYLVELKGDSAIRGYYYLKIDSEPDEFENHRKPFCFSKAVKCVEKKEIGRYYIMLLGIAGNSVQEYRKFHSIHSPGIKIRAAGRMAAEILEEAADGRTVVGEEICPAEMFQMQLGNKLAPDRKLYGFLKCHLSENKIDNFKIEEISSIQAGGDILPNAFAFAANKKLWKEKQIKNMACCIHGDLHRGNVFVSARTGEYAMIDMAYYREDGWLFFDTAYFEFNLMLHNLKKEPLESWIFSIRQVAKQAWDEVDFKDSKVIRVISEEENQWIRKKVTDRFNYLDQFRLARILARVLAGLNYAGKRDIPDENRFRAYLFACCCLEEALRMEGIHYISPQIREWKQ